MVNEKSTNERPTTKAQEQQHGQSSEIDANSPESIELSEEAAELIRTLESERDQAIESRKRALADFQNYQRRAVDNERRALQEGAIRTVRAILPVLDHFDLALGQSASTMTVEQLIGGVKIVRDELLKALQTTGVERIDPQPGDPFDPNRHEAMMRQAAKDIDPGCIVSALQPGYVIGDQTLRPAKVIIAAGEEAPAPASSTEEQE